MRLKRVLGAVLSGAMVPFPGCMRRRRRRGDHSGIQGRRDLQGGCKGNRGGEKG